MAIIKRLFTSTGGLWFLRQLLQFGGAYLVFKGYTDEAGAEQAIDAVFQIGGPVALLAGFAGNVFSSFRNKLQRNGETITRLPPNDRGIVRSIADQAIAEKKDRPSLFKRLLDGLIFRPTE